MHPSAVKGRRGHFVPRVEALEERLTPAVASPKVLAAGIVEFSATPASSGSNVLNIFDDGFGDITFNTTSNGSGSRTSLPKGAGPIHEIVYVPSTASDVFDYRMLNNAPLLENMQVVVLMQSPGNKSFTALFGTPSIAGTPGAPGVNGTPSTPAVPVNVRGTLGVTILGSPYKDNVTLSYVGIVTGQLSTVYRDPQHSTLPKVLAQTLDGDKVSFTLSLLPGSTGHVHPKIQGGIGNDALTLFVFKKRRTDPVRIDGVGALNGGPGINSGFSEPPITEVNIQS
jgi:hypothetical protein